MHCGKPLCLDACPEEAITKSADGIVLINPDLCTGCKQCIEACPFGIPQLNPETGIAEKCTLCAHRIDKGLEPACVLACPTNAIGFGDINRLSELKKEKFAQNMV
jgi:Fe-S-cluster-containing dehydrogenase component